MKTAEDFEYAREVRKNEADKGPTTLAEVQSLTQSLISTADNGIGLLESIYDTMAVKLGMEAYYDRPTAQTLGGGIARESRTERLGHIADEISSAQTRTDGRINTLMRLLSGICDRLD